jgi:hypothetical protein
MRLDLESERDLESRSRARARAGTAWVGMGRARPGQVEEAATLARGRRKHRGAHHNLRIRVTSTRATSIRNRACSPPNDPHTPFPSSSRYKTTWQQIYKNSDFRIVCVFPKPFRSFLLFSNFKHCCGVCGLEQDIKEFSCERHDANIVVLRGTSVLCRVLWFTAIPTPCLQAPHYLAL